MTTLYKKRNLALKMSPVLFLCLFFGLLLLLPLFVFAQETFVPLTKGGIPGIESGTGFSGFLNAAFNLGLAVAATLAVVMITIGGLQYMTTDSIYGKGEGRDRIQNAVIGLILALLIWLILYTINPNLLKFDVNLGDTNSRPTDYEYEAYRESLQGGGTLKTPSITI